MFLLQRYVFALLRSRGPSGWRESGPNPPPSAMGRHLRAAARPTSQPKAWERVARATPYTRRDDSRVWPGDIDVNRWQRGGIKIRSAGWQIGTRHSIDAPWIPFRKYFSATSCVRNACLCLVSMCARNAHG
jgi:hypothetical protein